MVALGARSWTQPETEVSDVPSQGRRATEGWVSEQVEENRDAATCHRSGSQPPLHRRA